ncbi:MAG: OmpA family protein, partial [Treponema sp.]|nr:OmpA family protein [Treponema sp.]
MTMKKFTLIILLVLSFTPVFSQRLMTNADPKIFQFKFNKNDQSRILSTVNEDVYLNGRFNHNAVILNRISSVITDVDENGSGTADAVFMTTETSARTWNNKSSTWGEEYESVFTRDVTGKYEMEDIYFMPTVRDVPIFPDYKIKPGDTWKKQGYEAHDMRRTFGIEKPFMFPFEATYTYRGDMEGENGNVLSLIEINYNMFFTTPNLKAQTEAVLEAPKITTGYSQRWPDHMN